MAKKVKEKHEAVQELDTFHFQSRAKRGLNRLHRDDHVALCLLYVELVS